MRCVAQLMASILLVLQAVACAGTGNPESIYEADMGRATAVALSQHVPNVLNRYTFVLYRTESRGQMGLYYETEWKDRQPLEDEAALGYREASTRIIIEAKRSGVPLWQRDLFRVRFIAENRLRRTSSSKWEEPPLTDMCREYIGRIVLDIKRETGTHLY